MYEHPYLSRQITLFEQEQMERAAARRRMLIERADQIVPRPAGAVRRMLRRAFGMTARAAAAQTSTQTSTVQAAARPSAVQAATTRTATVCDASAAPAR